MSDNIEQSEALRRAGQQALDAERSREDRNRLGQFPTPPLLAIQIARFAVEQLGERTGITFLEPSVGSGVFYYGLLKSNVRKRIDNAVGIEIDNGFAVLARDVWGPHGLAVIESDFFKTLSDGVATLSPNLLIANPPYSRHHHLNGDTKRHLQRLIAERTELKVSGLAGLYIYFFLLATSLLRKGGVAAWLIPSEFMDVNYGSALREYLTRHVTTLRIHRYDPSDTQFDDALVTSTVVVVRNEPSPADWEVEFTYGEDLDAPATINRQPVALLRKQKKWAVFANGHGEANSNHDHTGVVTLGDLFKIQRGIATGANQFFVMSRPDARALGIPDDFLKPILPAPRHLGTTIVEADNDGFPVVERQMVLFDSDVPESTIEREYPAVRDFLMSEAADAIKGRYLLTRRAPWYRQERRAPAPYMITYMGRGNTKTDKPFRFIRNKSRAVGTNMYLMLYPKKKLLDLLTANPQMYDSIFDALNEITSASFRQNGRVYGGGLHKVEPGELASIPVPHIIEQFPELAADQQTLFIS